MKIINAGYEFITPINGNVILQRIEQALSPSIRKYKRSYSQTEEKHRFQFC